MGRVKRAWLAAAAWVAVIETLTSLPGSALPNVTFPIRLDWPAHFLMYAVLGVLAARAGLAARWQTRTFVLLALAVSVFGALDELHQLFIPGRDCELMDWVMDTGGSATGVATLVWAAGTTWGAWLSS